MQDRPVIIRPAPFRAPKVMQAPHGATVRQMVDAMYEASGVPAVMRTYQLDVEIDGVPVPRSAWSETVPDVNAHILILAPVHGGDGKNPLRTILSIVVVIVAAVATWYAGGAGGWASAGALGLEGAAASAYGAAVGMAVMSAGMLLVNAIAPIRTPDSGFSSSGAQSYADSPTYSLSGAQNNANPFGPIPVVLGRHRMYPPYGARPYTELVGNDEYLRMLFVWGYGPLKIDDIKIGETPITSFSGVTIETVEGWPNDPAISLFPADVYQDAIGVELVQASGRVIRTAQAGADELSVDVSFPQGLAQFDAYANRTAFTVILKIEYREVGATDWIDISTTLPVAGKVFQPPPVSGYDFVMSDIITSSFPLLTYSIYVSESGAVFMQAGQSNISGAFRVGEAYRTYTDGFGSAMVTVVTDLSSAYVTGCVCSALEDGTINVTAGTVTPPSLEVTAATSSTIRRNRHWLVDRTKQYEVAVSRTTADTDDTKIIDTVYWTNLRSITNEPPVTYPQPLAMTAMRIKASDQLQGIIDSLNAIVTSYAPAWDGEDWTTELIPIQNPAALFRAVLMHNANVRRRTTAQIDSAGLGEWFEFCEEQGYKFNMVRDYRASVWATLADIAASGRASPSLTDGVWGVVVDRADKAVVQHFTPRNSWGFKAEKSLFYRPHAFRIPFTNENEGYEKDERIVYDDGYSVSNATDFESVEFPGVTDPNLVWKFGRFHIAQARLRPETYSLYADFEHLVCRRGDKVRVSHDVPLWGAGWGRVKSLILDGDNLTGVVLDEKVLMESSKAYGCRFRLADADNTSLCLSVVTVAGETDTLTFQAPIPAASGPQAGDLAMFGEANSETAELLVKGIERQNDYVARLILVDESTEIYEADSGEIPAFNTNITAPMSLTRVVPPPPSITSIETGTAALAVTAAGVVPRMLVYLAPSLNSAVRIEKYAVRYREEDDPVWSSVEMAADNTTAVVPNVTQGVNYKVQARAVSIYGVVSAWSAETTAYVVGEAEPPSGVTGFACNILGVSAYLSWNPVADPDLSHYRVRWSPASTGATWAESVDLVLKVGKPATSITVPAMTGSYLIKAVDYQGNESGTAAVATTSISQVLGINLVETISQASPGWSGTGIGVVNDGIYGGLILEMEGGAIPDSGTWELDDVVDLGGVFQCRVTAGITASGEDLLADLYDVADLYALANLYAIVEGLCSASLELRTTNDDPGDDPTWSAWMPFVVGDYTGRAYQFRLVLIGTPPGNTPIVTAVSITVDMPDRVLGFEASIESSGARIDFDPAFFITPKIGIAVTNGQEGDAYTITNLDETGFDIAFTNGGNPVARNITGVARAYGSKEA